MSYYIQLPEPHGPGYEIAGSPVSCRQLEADAAIVPPSYTPDKCCRCRLFSENLKHFFIFTEFSNSSTFTLHFISFSMFSTVIRVVLLHILMLTFTLGSPNVSQKGTLRFL